MKSKVLFVASTTESNSHGPLALYSGRVSSHPGDALVAVSLLTPLFVAALAMLFGQLIQQGTDGSRSLPSTNTDSRKRKRIGGMERGQYDEK